MLRVTGRRCQGLSLKKIQRPRREGQEGVPWEPRYHENAVRPGFRRYIFILNDARNLLQEKGPAAYGERYEHLTMSPHLVREGTKRQLGEAGHWAGRHPAHITHHKYVRRHPNDYF